MRRYSIQVDLFCNRQNVSEICLASAVEFRCREDCPVDDSGGRRHRPTAYFLFLTVVVQMIERPLGLSLATAEAVHQQIEADRLLGRESLFVLNDLRVVVDELPLGVRCNNDIEIRQEARVEP